MGIINTKGIIIKEYTVGESDKFIGIFTKSNGKIMVNAPYAKRHNRGLASGTQIFVYAQFVVQETKGSYKLLQVDPIEPFHNLRNDLFKLAYSSYILEFVDKTMEVNLQSPDVLRLIVRTLQAMCKDIIKPNLIRHIFELKHMCLLGFMPNMFSCNACGLSYDECPKRYFDIIQSGLVCADCYLPSQYSFSIAEGTLHAMQYVVSVHIDDLFTFNLSDKVLLEYRKIMSKYISYYIDKNFKTLKFIEDFETIN